MSVTVVIRMRVNSDSVVMLDKSIHSCEYKKWHNHKIRKVSLKTQPRSALSTGRRADFCAFCDIVSLR